ncbi:hypothetical protein [Methylobacterium fujisawaense]|uniref:hypothetical protein n=1 Tax=Methylobacterium fujisawaense TaxID=107400 RepID=UPI002F35D71E
MLFHDGVLVNVVMMVVDDGAFVAMLLDDAVGMLDVVAVAVYRDAAGADVHVLRGGADRGEGKGGRGGQGGKRELHP